jgi:hypothetical protein
MNESKNLDGTVRKDPAPVMGKVVKVVGGVNLLPLPKPTGQQNTTIVAASVSYMEDRRLQSKGTMTFKVMVPTLTLSLISVLQFEELQVMYGMGNDFSLSVEKTGSYYTARLISPFGKATARASDEANAKLWAATFFWFKLLKRVPRRDGNFFHLSTDRTPFRVSNYLSLLQLVEAVSVGTMVEDSVVIDTKYGKVTVRYLTDPIKVGLGCYVIHHMMSTASAVNTKIVVDCPYVFGAPARDCLVYCTLDSTSVNVELEAEN